MMTKEFAEAFLAAQQALRPVIKNSNNPHFKSKFADLGEVTDAAKEALNGNGIAFTQGADPIHGGDGIAGISVVTTFIHVSGQMHEVRCTVAAKGVGPQDYGSAITYGRRYGLAAAMGIVADVDDDANAAQSPPSGGKRPPLAAVPSPPPLKGKPITEAEKTVLDAFWPRTDADWEHRISQLKTQQDCRTCKQAILLYLEGETTHALYKTLEARYNAIGEEAARASAKR